MPATTALELFNAYKLKIRQNPGASRTTLFKYLLWDRFKGKMIMDAELNEMATSSANLSELSFKVLSREKPNMVAGNLEAAAKSAIKQFFVMNSPDEV